MHELVKRIADLDPRRRQVLDALIARAGLDGEGLPILPESRERRDFPVSLGQQRLWFLDRLEPGSAAYHLNVPIAVEGALDIAALTAAIDHVMARHAALRAVIETVDGEPRQRLVEPCRRPLPEVDLSALDEARAVAEVCLEQEVARPFVLDRGPLARAVLLRLGGERFILAVTMHHIISDGWSQGIFIREVGEAYRALSAGEAPELPPIVRHFTDFAAWQRRHLHQAVLGEQIAYWRRRLAGAPPSLELPTDFPRPARQSFRGASIGRLLAEPETPRIAELARRHGTTPFVVLLAAFKVFLWRLSGQSDVLVGIPVAGRDRTELEPMIGFFINSLVVRTAFADRPSFDRLVERVRDGFLGDHEHQDVPFEKLVEELDPPRDPSRTPLFQVFFNMLNLEPVELELEGLRLEQLPPSAERSMFDLTLYAAERGGRYTLTCNYSTDLFDAERIERWLDAFAALLAALLDDPAQGIDRPRLPGPERTPTAPWLRPPEDEAAPVWRRVAEHASTVPDRLAVVDGEGSLTYGELERSSARLAARLESAGLGPGEPVAIHAARGAGLVLSLLAVARTGASWLVLDPAFRPARLASCLEAVPVRAWLDLVGEIPPLVEERLSAAELRCRLTLDAHPRTPLPDAGPAPDGPDADAVAQITFTSGSTGRPKAVIAGSRPLAQFVAWQIERFALTAEDRFSLLSGLAHDPLMRDVFTPLAVGATLCLPAVELGDPGGLAAWLATERVTVSHLTPSLGRSLTVAAGSGRRLPSLRWLFFGGEVLRFNDLAAWRRLAPGVSGVSFYGATETPQAVSWHAAQAEQPLPPSGAVPLGFGVGVAELLVIGPGGEVAGVDELGEIQVRTPHLSYGYLNDAALTALRFVPDPLGDGDRLYRTGDLGRYLPSGEVAFAGRRDRQLKVRGFRVEPAEIEAVLLSHPELSAAAVVSRPAVGDGVEDWLVAYLVRRDVDGGEGVRAHELRRLLASRLPAYMVPSRFVFVDALPRTPNGKLDERALPSPPKHAEDVTASGPAPSKREEEAPRDASERVMARLWAELLELDEVAPEADFFALGGHSLLATRLLDRVRRELGVEISLRAFFAAPTVAGLSAALRQAEAGEDLPRLVPDREARHEPFPLTDIQEAYWVGRGEAVELGNVASHRYLEMEVDELDLELLASSWNRLVARHDMLRAVVQGDGTQRILAEVASYEITVRDLRGLPSEEAEEELRTVRDELSHQILAPERWPLFELRASRLGETRYRLHFSFDYLVADAASFNVLLRELVRLYRRPEDELPALEISFRDYVLALESFRSSRLYERSRRYWLDRVPDLPAAPELPRRAGAELSTPEFVRRHGRLAAPAWRFLQEEARRRGLTAASVLLTAFGEVLARWSREPRFTLVLTLFNRLPLHPQVEDLVGDFTTTSLLAVENAAEPTFEDRGRHLQSRLWDDLDHRYFSGVQVLREVARHRGSGLRATMPVVFTSTLHLDKRSAPSGGEQGAAASAQDQGFSRVYGISQTPQVWLDHQVWEEDGELCFNWDAVESIFPSGLLDAMFAGLTALLDQLSTDASSWSASSLELLPEEQRTMLRAYNQTDDPTLAAEVRGKLLHQPFLTRAREDASRPAVISAGRSLTYGELRERAAGLVEELHAVDAAPGTLVGVVMEKGWEQVAAVLAILEHGCAYLPIDPELPAERRRHLLERGEVGVALTRSAAIELPEGVRRLDVLPPPSPAMERGVGGVRTSPADDELAYVIFTSGSTGQPKGVAIEHRSALNTVLDINQRFAVGPEDRVLALSSLSFDLSVYDLFGLLAAGGAVVLAAPEERRDPAAWARLLDEHRVTIWNTVPALMEMLVEYLEGRPEIRPRSLRLVLLSGDWIPLSLPSRIKALFGDVEVISLGGATEASIWSIYHRIEAVEDDWASIPYGRPLSAQHFHVLDQELRPCPVWARGELYIGGVGLARGYWRDPEKTAAAFIEHPLSGERLYRTGDLGRFLPSGEIEFLGREDLQVKVQGYRIELGEIEAQLSSHPEVEEAIVVAVGERQGSKSLAAFVRPSGEPELDPAELRRFLSDRLPTYMVPSRFVSLTAWPLTANGKIDRGALAEQVTSSTGELAASASVAMPVAGGQRPAAPLAGSPADGPALDRAVALLNQLLRRDEAIDTELSLLELGVSSVDLVRFANLLEDEFGARPALEDLFHLPLSAALRSGRRVQQGAVASPATGGETAGTSWRLLRDPGERQRFKEAQPGLRALAAEPLELERPALDGAWTQSYVERRSRRHFSHDRVSVASLTDLLANLRQMSWDGQPKYRYASAGGLYPVQLYLYAKPGRTELDAGCYYYHPVEHRLYHLDGETRLEREHYGWVNRPIFDEAAFALILVAQMRAIAPMYGELSRDFCLIEAGLISQLLDSEAPGLGLGLCQIGRLELEPLRAALRLEGDHLFLYSLLGGGLEPEAEREALAKSIAEAASITAWEDGEL